MPDAIAVYGTLMDGIPLPGKPELAGRLRHVGPCLIRGRLYDLGAWPGLVEGDGRVAGELHELLSADALAVLDAYEGYDPTAPAGSPYVRVRARLLAPAGAEAWVYVYRRPVRARRLVADGDWRRELRRRAGYASRGRSRTSTA